MESLKGTGAEHGVIGVHSRSLKAVRCRGDRVMFPAIIFHDSAITFMRFKHVERCCDTTPNAAQRKTSSSSYFTVEHCISIHMK